MRIRPLVLKTMLGIAPTVMRLGRVELTREQGRTLDPRAEALRVLMNRSPSEPLKDLSPAEFRERTQKIDALFFDSGPRPAEQRDLAIDLEGRRLPARLIIPAGPSEGLLVYFHGGGFVVGDLESHDGICRGLAKAAKTRVLSVAYRLAPEHPHPAAVKDATEVLQAVLGSPERFGLSRGRVAIGGDSSGANLATVATLEARSRGLPLPCCQLMIYPVTDLSRKAPSYRCFSRGFGLTEEHMDWGIERYVGSPTAALDPRVSPLLWEDLAGLPPAIVITAGFDLLHNEGEAYAQRLREAGVDVVYRCYDGMLHGFLRFFEVMKPARDALEFAARELRRYLDQANDCDARVDHA